jgi:hypothetical protein
LRPELQTLRERGLSFKTAWPTAISTAPALTRDAEPLFVIEHTGPHESGMATIVACGSAACAKSTSRHP